MDLSRSYIEILAAKDDVLGRRVTSKYRFSGAWSVLLRPGGHHVNHIHPLGWISSAFHVELPPAVGDGHQGWLKFGEPELATVPKLEAEHFVKPDARDPGAFPVIHVARDGAVRRRGTPLDRCVRRTSRLSDARVVHRRWRPGKL